MMPAADLMPSSFAQGSAAKTAAAARDRSDMLREVTLGIVLCILVTAGAIAVVLLLLGNAQWWWGFLAAGCLSIIAGALSLLPLWIGASFGAMGLLGGHFAAIALRLLVVLAGALLLIEVGGYAATPVLLLSVPFYFALLAGEVITLARRFLRDSARDAGSRGLSSN